MNVTRLPSPAWRDRLQLSANGVVKANLHNAITAVRGISQVSDRFWWDDFHHRIVVSGKLPWGDEVDDRPWLDWDDAKLTEFVQASDVPVGLDLINVAVRTVAMERRRNCLQEWLAGLKWDGTPRIGNWLPYYFGVESTAYTEAVGRAWLISAVARAMDPGCKADHVLILEGKQGKGKSSAIHALVGGEFYTDEISDFGSKDAALQMSGSWVIELGELDVVSRSAIERTKAFLSRRSDRYRPPYAKYVVDQPRQCVFVGTSNNVVFQDATGNRRFWPVQVKHVDIAGLAAEREQIWAETVSAYRAGEPWWITSDDVAADAEVQQHTFITCDPWDHACTEWLVGRDRTTTAELLSNAIGLSIDKRTRKEEMRVASYLKNNGWDRKQIRRNGERIWLYFRNDNKE